MSKDEKLKNLIEEIAEKRAEAEASGKTPRKIALNPEAYDLLGVQVWNGLPVVRTFRGVTIVCHSPTR